MSTVFIAIMKSSINIKSFIINRQPICQIWVCVCAVEETRTIGRAKLCVCLLTELVEIFYYCCLWSLLASLSEYCWRGWEEYDGQDKENYEENNDSHKIYWQQAWSQFIFTLGFNWSIQSAESEEEKYDRDHIEKNH